MDYSWDLEQLFQDTFCSLKSFGIMQKLQQENGYTVDRHLLKSNSGPYFAGILAMRCEDDGDIFTDNHCSTALSGGWPWRKGRPTSHVPSLPITCVRPYWLEMNKYLPHARKNVLSPTRHVGSTCHCFRENVLTWDGQIFTISWIYFYFAPNYYF